MSSSTSRRRICSPLTPAASPHAAKIRPKSMSMTTPPRSNSSASTGSFMRRRCSSPAGEGHVEGFQRIADRDEHTDAGVGAVVGHDAKVGQADDVAFVVEHRSAAVAVLDVRFALDEAMLAAHLEAADDAGGHALTETERRADHVDLAPDAGVFGAHR